MKRIIVTTLIITTALVSCEKKSKKKNSQTQVQKEELVKEIPEGKKLLESKCFLCHNPATEYNSIVAPPMVAVKAMYLKDGMSREEFIKQFVDFSKSPTLEKAKLEHAVKRFKVMPKQQFFEDDLVKIAEYVHDFQIQEPTWFKEHWKEKHGTPYNNSGKKLAKIKVKKTLAEIGMSYALGTKKVLGKNLMGTIQKKGTLEALKFCNHKAYPLTDSMSTKFKATIKRVSDKTRNPKNVANQKELAVIENYKKMLANNEKLKPVVEKMEDGHVQFYAPIKTNGMCLQCHGTPNKQIKPTTLEKLAELYPHDKAQNYKANQIRGIWSINFKPKKNE